MRIRHTQKVCSVLKENLFSCMVVAFLINDQIILPDNGKITFPKLYKQIFLFEVFSFSGEFQYNFTVLVKTTIALLL